MLGKAGPYNTRRSCFLLVRFRLKGKELGSYLPPVPLTALVDIVHTKEWAGRTGWRLRWAVLSTLAFLGFGHGCSRRTRRWSVELGKGPLARIIAAGQSEQLELHMKERLNAKELTRRIWCYSY